MFLRCLLSVSRPPAVLSLRGLHACAPQRVPAGVTLVKDALSAAHVVEVLRAQGPACVHAVDTEVVDLDLEEQSPVGHGRIICASLYSGPTVDYGSGPRVWIDCTGEDGSAALAAFKPALEDPAVRKVWHNFSFDRHMLFNHGINASLAADTMHMARLWDTSRITRGGYSLEGLSADLLDRRKVPMKELFARPRMKKVCGLCGAVWRQE